MDVTHATDAPGIDVKEAGKHELGSGPVISRGSTLNEGVFELLHETAESEKIPFTVEASARATGTDADAVHISRGGVPTGLVSIPLRYMHSPVELVQLDDVHACARLIAAAALRLGRDALVRRARRTRGGSADGVSAPRVRPLELGQSVDDLVGLARGSRRSRASAAPRARVDLALGVRARPARTSPPSSVHALAFDLHPSGPAESRGRPPPGRFRRGRVRGSRRSSGGSWITCIPNAVTPSSARALTKPPPWAASIVV